MKLQFEYFYGREVDDFTFYRIPKKIITSPHFKDVSYGAKMLYGLLFDRVGLSIKNSWFDNENRAYIIFSIHEVMESMYCSKPTAIKFMSELEDAGLIERQKRGRGLTDYIYVKKIVDNEKVVKNIDHKELKDFTSDGQVTEHQEVKDFNPNNTNINNNYFNDIYTIPPPKSREYYEEIIKENIEYDILKLDFKGEWLDNITELMLDVLCSDSKTIRVNQRRCSITQKQIHIMILLLSHSPSVKSVAGNDSSPGGCREGEIPMEQFANCHLFFRIKQSVYVLLCKEELYHKIMRGGRNG